MDDELLAEARQAQERLIDAERDAEAARADFHRAVRRLHLRGSSLRELAAALGLSHQRMHQIVAAAGGSRRWTRHRDTRPDPPLACTFCGRPREETRCLIAGPGACICNDCADLAENVISSGAAARTGLAQLTAVPAQETRARCSFCGKYRHQVPGVAVSTAQTERKAPAMICTECLALCAEISRDELPPG